jgi:hypothetical protein
VCLRALPSFLFECAFEPSTIKGSAFSIIPPFECAFEPSPHFFSSAPSSPRPFKVVRFLTLPHFECTLEPSFPFEHASEPSFPSSFHLLNSATSSPIMSSFEKSSYFSNHWAGNPLQCDYFWKILVFFHWAGNSLQCDHFWKILVFFHWAGDPLQCDHPKKSSYFSTGQVTHYNVTNLKNPRMFQASGRWPITMWPLLKNPRMFQTSGRWPITMWPSWKILVFFHWAGHPLQCDHPEKSSYFSTGQVTHYNVTNLKKSSYVSNIGQVAWNN